MRVIAGSARRLLLKTPEGMETRPTTDRIKETLFNMIQDDLYHCQFLDLFSGSGAIGIEALSRGARQAVFVENHPDAVETIRSNLNTTRLEEQAIVMNCDVMTALKRLEERGFSFDFIFMDAAKGQYIRYMPQVLRLLRPGGTLVTDNVLQDGDIIESRFAVERRNRTIHSRMREYLYELKHHELLTTSIIPLGDGVAVSVKKQEGE